MPRPSFLLLTVLFALTAAPALAAPALEKFTYREDFETRELRAWAAYPHWEDTSYNENFRVNAILPDDPNLSIEAKITPYTVVDNYVGAQKLLDMYLTPESTLRLRYYLKTIQPVESFTVRFAAGTFGKLDAVVPHPETNTWVWLDLSWDDFARENPGIMGMAALKVNALAVLAKIPMADPAMPIYLGIDDIDFQGARETPFVFAEPKALRMREWKPLVATQHYRPGDMFTVRGTWTPDADRVSITVTPFAAGGDTLFRADLVNKGGEWSLAPRKADFPAGFHRATLTAWKKGDRIASTELAFMVARPDWAGKHPRLWFDAAKKSEIASKLATDRFKRVADGIRASAKAARDKTPVEKVVDDIGQFPEEDWLATIDGWFDRIVAWRQGVYQNTLAWTFLGDREAGLYAKDLLVKICGFPTWVHPWFVKRGQFFYYPLGEAGSEFAIGYDCLYDLMSESERKTVRDGLARNIVQACHKGWIENNLTTNNTSNWVANIASGSLMVQAAIYGDDPAMNPEPYLTGALFKEEALIRSGFGRDGGYGEPNGYHYFTMDGLSQALPAIENVFGIDMTAKLRSAYTELIWAGLVKRKYTFYYGKSGGEMGPLTYWAWLLPKYKDPLLGWFYHFMKSGETLNDAIYDTESVPREDPFTRPPVRAFRDMGTTVFKSGWETDDFVFVMRSGPFYNHQFMDQGSFWLSDRGSLFIERRHGSTEPYIGATCYEPWYIQPFSHSTILLDMNHQSQRTGDCLGFAGGFEDYAFIGHFLDGTNAAFSQGDIGRLYWGRVKSMQRNVLYLKPRTLLMLDTVYPADKDVEANLLYQTARLQDITAGGSVSAIEKNGNTLFIHHLAPEHPRVEQVETPHYFYTLLREKPLVKEGMLVVSAKTDGNPLVMANLLTSTKGERPDVSTARGNGCVTGKAGAVPFAFSTRPGHVYTTGEYATDALAVTWDGSTIFAALATTLSRGGALLVRSSAPVTCEITPSGMKYYIGSAAKVAIGVSAPPKAVTVNGKAVTGAAYDVAGKTVTIELTAGEGEVRVRE